MKRILLALMAAALCLLPINLPAAEPPAAPTAVTAAPAPKPAAPKPVPVTAITIIVPAVEILPGEDYDLSVTGVTPADLTPGKVFFLPPESSLARVKLTVQWTALGLEPVITFRAKSPGSYRVTLVKAVPVEKLLAATAIVVVKGAQPDPFPDPDPKPDPAPVKLTAVAIVEETAERSKLPVAQRALIGNATFRQAVEAKGLKFRRIDPDDQLPAEWQWAVKAASAKPLPVLAFYDGAIAKAIPLPADEAAAVKLLTTGGVH